MKLSRLSFLAASLFVLAGIACSENPNATKLFTGRRTSILATPATLDQGVMEVLSLFPKGLETAATTRWGNIKQKYAAGLTDPAQMKVARQMLFELSAWVNQKTPNMDLPETGETKIAAASRAVLYMSMYIYSGPLTPPPKSLATADNAVGLVTPGAPATITTPTTHAGVQLEAGSVAENTIIVVTQNATPYPENCSGPLQTKLCQYPQFYTFEMFPHKRLIKPAKFNVCHVNIPESQRYPLADHDRFKLAHAKPANAADYTPGSTIRDSDGESIEILQMVPQSFSHCENSAYVPETEVIGSLGILSRLARGLQNLVSPKTAYAVDVGLGGLSIEMSPFNDVDPEGRPDFAAQSLTAGEGLVHGGDHVTVNYLIKNVGTATGAGVPFSIRLLRFDGDNAFSSEEIGTGTTSGAIPGVIVFGTNSSAVIPGSLPPGTYSLQLVLGSNETFPDPNAANNTATASITIGEVWRVLEDGNWNGTWARRGASDVFDAIWTGPPQSTVTGVMTYTRNGDQVEFQRTESSNGDLCHYVGTLFEGGTRARGTETCPNEPGTVSNWEATIGSQ
ncbi:MAG: hypothetical protein QOK07_1555 [Gemmatimonadaceae bacterium]|nr:hypothetical protein [Gemmatimonadaceae bacterium]